MTAFTGLGKGEKCVFIGESSLATERCPPRHFEILPNERGPNDYFETRRSLHSIPVVSRRATGSWMKECKQIGEGGQIALQHKNGVYSRGNLVQDPKCNR